jgi:hypothetical protein
MFKIEKPFRYDSKYKRISTASNIPILALVGFDQLRKKWKIEKTEMMILENMFGRELEEILNENYLGKNEQRKYSRKRS